MAYYFVSVSVTLTEGNENSVFNNLAFFLSSNAVS